ncbi:hypothetical protein EBQ74_09345 [bacterium]|nr:hypothetical protein [bacterium]
MKILLILIFLGFQVFGSETENNETKKFRFDFEGALAWQSLNRNQIPNSSDGTRFDLADFNRSAIFAPRFYLSYQLSENHSLRALVFPFETKEVKHLIVPLSLMEPLSLQVRSSKESTDSIPIA